MSPATMDGFPRNATRSAPYPIRMQIFSSSGSRCAHRLEGIHRITAKSGGDGVGKVPEIVLSLSPRCRRRRGENGKITSFWRPGERAGEADCSSPLTQISQEILLLIHSAATAHRSNDIPMGHGREVKAPLIYFLCAMEKGEGG